MVYTGVHEYTFDIIMKVNKSYIKYIRAVIIDAVSRSFNCTLLQTFISNFQKIIKFQICKIDNTRKFQTFFLDLYLIAYEFFPSTCISYKVWYKLYVAPGQCGGITVMFWTRNCNTLVIRIWAPQCNASHIALWG